MAALIQHVPEIRISGLELESNYSADANGTGGVYITWEDLWVTVPTGKGDREQISILGGVTGYARPGELLAVMGPSGCGKSTLLDALSGRVGPNTRQRGEILINGRQQPLAYGTWAKP